MNKNSIILVLTLLFCSVTVVSQDITFNVDLNGSGSPTSPNNSIRIGANTNPNGDWQGDYVELTDADNDGVYSGTAINAPVGSLLFRVYEGPVGSSGWTGGFISDISKKGCPANESAEANYAITVVAGEDQTLDFTLNECLSLNNAPIIGVSTRWDFDTLSGWVDGSQNMDGVINYSITNGEINMFTRANTWDRPKVRTENKIYNEGRYSWRVFVPEMGVGDMASIGAFLYSDDRHELDFEIGYGTSVARQTLNAASDEVLAYMTSQANPFVSIPVLIKRNQWYIIEIDLAIVNGVYEVVWYINNVEKLRRTLTFGDEDPFSIFCSVENLTFLGDHIPDQNNYALFDYVEFNDGTNLSIKKEETYPVSIYPNPVNDVLNIQSVNNIESISVYNFFGSKVLVYNNVVKTINTSSLDSGVYILETRFDVGKSILKFIKI